MRALHCNLFMTLDGVVEAPGEWSMAYWNDEIQDVMVAAMSSSDGLVLGRVGYQEFAAAWSGRTTQDDEGADFMNDVRKHVASRTLTSVEWHNSTLLEGDGVEAVAALKQTEGGKLMTSGSPTFVRALLAAGLVDELHLLVYPIARGHGQRLCAGPEPLSLRLVSSQTFDNGVLHLVYQLVG